MSDLREALAAKVAPLIAPIPGAEPQGIEASYEPDFELVKTELDKLSQMGGGIPDWRQVVSGSEQLLAQKTKDLRLAAWMAIGLMSQAGPEGLAQGLLGMLELSSAHWDGMFPPAKRARARGNLATWVADQVELNLASYQVKATDKDALALCESLYGELDDFFTEKLGDNYSGMGGMRNILRAKTRELPAEPAPPPPAPVAAPPPQTPAAPSADTGAAAAQAPAPPPPQAAQPAAAAVSASPAVAAGGVTAITNPPEANRAVKEAARLLKLSARVLRQADPTQAQVYRWHRMGVWMEVKGLPPAPGGKTMIPPPPAAKRQRLDGLVAAENWSQLIEVAEDMFGEHLFWLDTHRYLALAFDRSGAAFADAKTAMVREVTHLLAQFPKLLELKFSDGQPFADAAAEAWLGEELAKLGGSGGASAAASAASEEDAQLAERFEQAKELVLGGQVADGLGVAFALASRASDARARFRARLAVARLAIQGGQRAIARPIFEALAQEAEQHGLEVWEPELCVRVYSGLLSCLNKDASDVDEKEKFSQLFDRLCRLDPAAAIGLAG